jgi:Rrf2 family protein
MRITAKADYAVRATVELVPASEGAPRKADSVAEAQSIPPSFLENILNQLKSAGIVRSQRGPDGGWWLARPADEISLADIIRAVEGPLASIRGERPEAVTYSGPAAPLQQVWIALRANLRGVLENVSLADVANGKLPDEIVTLAEDREAWTTR